MSELFALWFASLRAARGESPWWRSPFVWALIVTVAALATHAVEGAAWAGALSTALLFVAGLLWMGVMAQLAMAGPELIAGFVFGVVVLAVAMRVVLAVGRYLS